MYFVPNPWPTRGLRPGPGRTLGVARNRDLHSSPSTTWGLDLMEARALYGAMRNIRIRRYKTPGKGRAQQIHTCNRKLSFSSSILFWLERTLYFPQVSQNDTAAAAPVGYLT